MRLFKKKQCIDILDTVLSAHNEAGSFLEKGRVQETSDLLEQCQQSAMAVGSLIEGSEGEGTEAVRILEEYCEKLYIMYADLTEGKTEGWHAVKKGLDRLILKVISEIRGRIKDERMVVFLPYKISMWDSLEGIWKKCCSEDGCIPVVMPIPYYDKNADGTPGEKHYEIDMFPGEVPVVSCEDMDLETEHPESIYIHNPYDMANHVTSVDPRFYSSRLKNYTDDLVYIPYFVLEEPELGDSSAVETMEYLVTVPGVINAHRVIVQSEAMKEVYVDIMTRYTRPDMRPYWEKKIEGTGSPKIEKVKTIRREDFDIPSEWKDLIFKRDGEIRKVVLYNTSVSGVMHYREKVIEKIKSVIREFRRHDDVVLLWRPHPLMEATVRSIDPELEKEYHDLVNAYRDGGFGIYDDSPDMYMAIAVSDAYYGDSSSVMTLYRYTGKPVMVQNYLLCSC
ncbi:MAG: CDP-glycerol glycerophosphotransferase family protein [Lachnospiraceae bacterium]|nr:CDP-glycerol glycerophosphotransferase family protein [Lachnospiraceae bacterium]